MTRGRRTEWQASRGYPTRKEIERCGAKRQNFVGVIRSEAGLRAERRAPGAKIAVVSRRSLAVWSGATKIKDPVVGSTGPSNQVQIVDAIDQADCVVACLVTLSA